MLACRFASYVRQLDLRTWDFLLLGLADELLHQVAAVLALRELQEVCLYL